MLAWKQNEVSAPWKSLSFWFLDAMADVEESDAAGHSEAPSENVFD
jgi:hypothetical protein